ncbi:MAG: hypothetical protein ACTSO7_11855 [Candidatus Heimdallarchaeota archaeon]
MRESYQIWFIVTACFGVLFTIWGSIAPSLKLLPGDYWLLLPGILMIILGALGIFDGYVIERRVIKYFANIGKDQVTLEQASKDLSISPDNLREFVLCLRSWGKLKVHFSDESPELIIIAKYDAELCSHCGQPVTNSEFCPVCGKSLKNE